MGRVLVKFIKGHSDNYVKFGIFLTSYGDNINLRGLFKAYEHELTLSYYTIQDITREFPT